MSFLRSEAFNHCYYYVSFPFESLFSFFAFQPVDSTNGKISFFSTNGKIFAFFGFQPMEIFLLLALRSMEFFSASLLFSQWEGRLYTLTFKGTFCLSVVSSFQVKLFLFYCSEVCLLHEWTYTIASTHGKKDDPLNLKVRQWSPILDIDHQIYHQSSIGPALMHVWENWSCRKP